MLISDQTVSEKTLDVKRLVVKIQLSRYCKRLSISITKNVRYLKRTLVLYCNVNRTLCQPEFEFVFCDVKSTVLLLLILALIFTYDTDILVVVVGCCC